MTEEPPEISILDARLAEIDRRLSSIQTGLADDISVQRQKKPPVAELPARVEVAAPPPAPEGAREVLDEIRALADAQELVLRSTRELLSAYERVLAQLPPAAPDAAAVREFSVSAGPFPSTEALRGFERTLSGIPEVREVAVRGYEGEDRAIVDVHLFEPNT
jgi:hypothetical protein